MVPEHTEVTVRIPVHTSEDCRAVSSVLARVGDKWSVLIIVLLGNGSKRFNEITLRHLTEDATLTLRGLERDGLVKRTQFPTIPPRVVYELTPWGVPWESRRTPRDLGTRSYKNIATVQAAFEKKIHA